jgi:hypothetical protein
MLSFAAPADGMLNRQSETFPPFSAYPNLRFIDAYPKPPLAI